MIYFYILVAIIVLIAIVRVQKVPAELRKEENKIHARARKIKRERARAGRRLKEKTSAPEEAGGWIFPGEFGGSDGGFDGGTSDGGGGSSTHF